MYKDPLPKMLKTKSDIFLLVLEQIHRISPASIPNFLWAFGLNPIEHFISILHTYIVVDDIAYSLEWLVAIQVSIQYNIGTYFLNDELFTTNILDIQSEAEKF